MPKKGYDFAGWVTKNDIKCSDGVTIKQDAFKGNDGTKVPLVWNHNYSTPSNILGHVVLHSKDKGVYGYGHFNDSEEAQHAKQMIEHGDISSMSIGAKQIRKRAQDVIHGMIYEVSLVLSGANPGATIEMNMAHSDDGEDTATIYTGNLIHAEDDVIEPKVEVKEEDKGDKVDKTIGDILGTLSEEQMDAVTTLLGGAIEDLATENEDLEQSDITEGEDLIMKNNVFYGQGQEETETLTHSDIKDIFKDAHAYGSLQESILQHGITDIDTLFPEAKLTTDAPIFYRDENTSYEKIVAGTTKSPFSRIKTMFADLTEDEARAKGYIKGNEKLEQVFGLMSRETTPQTIYKKQKLDRDDIIDITDFDVVSWMNTEMRFMLQEELARAILVGDGREVSAEDKIKEDKIRPIISDDDFYTLKRTYADPKELIEVVIKSMADYKGSGAASLYMDPALIADLRLLKADDGRFLFGDIPSKEAIATRLGVKEIVDTTLMAGQGALLVNLKDYHVGSTKGGEVTTFEDFDIDFNQHKYLIETRLSGALTLPHSAIHYGPTEVLP